MKRILLLSLAFLLLLSQVIAAPHAQYPAFGEPQSDFSFDLYGDVVASDDAVYKTGYYSMGGAWQTFSLTGDVFTGASDWLTGDVTGNINLDIGTAYVVIYSCSRESGAWDCHGGQWQLQVLHIPDSPLEEFCGNGRCAGGETCSDCPGDCGACPDPGTIEDADYYVAPDGSDSNPGTIDRPWKTWQKAFDNAGPGDLVYFRDGVYYTSFREDIGDLSGSAGAYIRFWAYPGETPILDGGQVTRQSEWTGGVVGSHANYIHFKGLTVRNFPQVIYNARPVGFSCSYCDNMIYENCVAHDIGARGFYFYAPDYIYVKNCDSYDNLDPRSDTPFNHGDGYLVWDQKSSEANLDSRVIFEGCRAWGNADDGWDAETEGYIELNNCWAFDQGNFDGAFEGNGFKIGLNQVPGDFLAKRIVNSIAADNRLSGITTNDRDRPAKVMEIYNNLAYNNGANYQIYWTSSSDEQERKRVFRNNVAFGDGGDVSIYNAEYTHSYNSWDTSVTVSDADFVSLDTAQLRAPRKADGSLPDITFGRLAAGSDLIDAGTNVGLDYLGSAPDLGWAERE